MENKKAARNVMGRIADSKKDGHGQARWMCGQDSATSV